jgi:hypothetical protein
MHTYSSFTMHWLVGMGNEVKGEENEQNIGQQIHLAKTIFLYLFYSCAIEANVNRDVNDNVTELNMGQHSILEQGTNATRLSGNTLDWTLFYLAERVLPDTQLFG